MVYHNSCINDIAKAVSNHVAMCAGRTEEMLKHAADDSMGTIKERRPGVEMTGVLVHVAPDLHMYPRDR